MEDTYEKILKAAYLVFSENGYENASLNKIKETAGVSKGAIYHYFKSKDELFYHVIKSYFEEFVKIFDQYSFDSLDKIKEFGFMAIDIYEQDQKSQNITMVLFQQSLKNKEIKELLEEYITKVLNKIGEKLQEISENGKLKEDVDINLLAQKIFVTMDTLGLYISYGIKNIDVRRLWNDFIDDYISQYYKK
ncbi:transcriptional regulator [Marinitoga piezophila KA3]|uniref:Transcriptional regulator n=1 Tax=Marinitoga piezophila (strain DSM 14283 / JCM 11233 / KA3) TaxID=443254 RepID=H2J7G3_MARPK|nr:MULTISPECIES: TetR/AcrR family transcriptional regulator [Marinitoga]AEX86456.1 transcriptional regulator [Marinitoga piezophila KA3]